MRIASRWPAPPWVPLSAAPPDGEGGSIAPPCAPRRHRQHRQRRRNRQSRASPTTGWVPGFRCPGRLPDCSRGAACGREAPSRSRALPAPRCCCPSRSPRRGRTPGARSRACPIWGCAPRSMPAWIPADSRTCLRTASSVPRCSPPWPMAWMCSCSAPISISPPCCGAACWVAPAPPTPWSSPQPRPGAPISPCAPRRCAGPVSAQARDGCAPRRLEVLASGRGIAGQREVEVLLPQVGGMIASAPQQRSRHENLAAPPPVRLLEPVRRAG